MYSLFDVHVSLAVRLAVTEIVAACAGRSAGTARAAHRAAARIVLGHRVISVCSLIPRTVRDRLLFMTRGIYRRCVTIRYRGRDSFGTGAFAHPSRPHHRTVTCEENDPRHRPGPHDQRTRRGPKRCGPYQPGGGARHRPVDTHPTGRRRDPEAPPLPYL